MHSESITLIHKRQYYHWTKKLGGGGGGGGALNAPLNRGADPGFVKGII